MYSSYTLTFKFSLICSDNPGTNSRNSQILMLDCEFLSIRTAKCSSICGGQGPDDSKSAIDSCPLYTNHSYSISLRSIYPLVQSSKSRYLCKSVFTFGSLRLLSAMLQAALPGSITVVLGPKT